MKSPRHSPQTALGTKVATFSLVGILSATAGFAGEWQTLFNGSDLSAWRVFGKPADAPITWTVQDGVLGWQKGGGNLMTRESYADFELELEWKVSPGGNSGILFRVDPTSEKPPQSGPEIQILDDARHKDGGNPATTAGSLYGLYARSKPVVKPVGQWNAMRLRVQGNRVQNWLNGDLIVDAEIGSPDWNQRVAGSKFAKWTSFAKSPSGAILLQDHGNPVWFRNIRVRRL